MGILVQPLWQCNPTHPGGMRKRIRRVKVRKLVVKVNILIGKAKTVCASKANQRIHSPLPITGSLPRKAGPHHCHGDLGRQKSSLGIFPLSLRLPPAKFDFIWSRIFLGSAGISWDSGCASPSFLGTPSLLSGGVRRSKGPNSVSVLLSKSKTSLDYLQHKSQPQPQTSYCEGNELSPTPTQHVVGWGH